MKRALLALALALAPMPAQAHGDWFALAPALQSSWRVEGDPHTSHRVTIAPRRASGRCVPVLVLTSMASSSYTIGLNKILEVFPREGVQARFTDIDVDGDKARAAAALAEIRAGRYALVFAMGSDATDYLCKHDHGDRTPVVTVEAKDPVLLGQIKDYAHGSGTNFAFTSLNAPVEVQLSYLKALKPQLRHLAILSDPSNRSAIATQVKPLAALARRDGLDVLDVVAGPPNVVSELQTGMPQAIARMRRDDPTLRNSIFWVVGSTAIFNHMTLINRLAGRVPVLSAVPDLVTAGEDSAVLAIGTTFEDDGYLAATYGAAILTGRAQPGALKVGVVSPPDIAISFLKTHELGLRIPFEFFEDANRVYDSHGRLAQSNAGKAPRPHGP